MNHEMKTEDTSLFSGLLAVVENSGIPFTIHEHLATRTVDEARQNLWFDVERIVKTVAFRTRSNRIVLAALRGTRRVDYARLANNLGVNRRDLTALSPDEVREILNVEPGSVSPVMRSEDIMVLIDDDVLTILPTLYCGIGRPDRTLEIEPAALADLTGGRTGHFSRREGVL